MASIPVPQLGQIDLFRGLSGDELSALAAVCSEATFADGQIILQEGEQSRTLWILLEGAAQVELSVKAGERQIAELHAPSIFGESSFFHAGPHSATVKSTGPTRVLRLDRDRFDELINQRSPAALRVSLKAAEILAARLQQTNRWIEQMLERQTDAKVHQAWQSFRQHMGHHFSTPATFVGIGANWD
jgi:CRP-like cAMP-binding protein